MALQQRRAATEAVPRCGTSPLRGGIPRESNPRPMAYRAMALPTELGMISIEGLEPSPTRPAARASTDSPDRGDSPDALPRYTWIRRQDRDHAPGRRGSSPRGGPVDGSLPREWGQPRTRSRWSSLRRMRSIPTANDAGGRSRAYCGKRHAGAATLAADPGLAPGRACFRGRCRDDFGLSALERHRAGRSLVAQPLMHITCLSVCTISTKSGYAAMTGSMSFYVWLWWRFTACSVVPISHPNASRIAFSTVWSVRLRLCAA